MGWQVLLDFESVSRKAGVEKSSDSGVVGCRGASAIRVIELLRFGGYFNLQCYIEKFVQLIIPLEDRLLFG